MKKLTPFQYWKKNKGRTDLRKLTRDFEKNFKIKNKCKFEPGKVYAITYTIDNNIPTDKHHVTPVILSLGSFRDENGLINIRGINILYLNTKQAIELLDDCYLYNEKSVAERVIPLVKIHDKYIKVFPWAFKNFIFNRIKTSIEINSEEWGIIPLLYKYLFGNFNVSALIEDFKQEIKTPIKIIKNQNFKKSKKENKQIEEQEEMIEIEDDMITINLSEE